METLLFFQDLTSIDIPAGFWSGDSKLALNSSSLHRVYTTFPTLYIAFASHENQTQEFSLGVTPQVSVIILSNASNSLCLIRDMKLAMCIHVLTN